MSIMHVLFLVQRNQQSLKFFSHQRDPQFRLIRNCWGSGPDVWAHSPSVMWFCRESGTAGKRPRRWLRRERVTESSRPSSVLASTSVSAATWLKIWHGLSKLFLACSVILRRLLAADILASDASWLWRLPIWGLRRSRVVTKVPLQSVPRCTHLHRMLLGLVTCLVYIKPSKWIKWTDDPVVI